MQISSQADRQPASQEEKKTDKQRPYLSESHADPDRKDR